MESYDAFLGNLFFTILAVVTVIPAIMVALTQHIVRAACWLLVSLSGAAGLFFMMGADFVGATQLLIYVGGTLVLVIFGVMLTATGPFVNMSSRSGDWAMAMIAGTSLFALVAYGLLSGPFWKDEVLFPPREAVVEHRPTTNRIGLAFLGFMPAEDARPEIAPAGKIAAPEPKSPGYLLPFEIVSVHLVVVLIGAAYLARAKRRVAKGV